MPLLALGDLDCPGRPGFYSMTIESLVRMKREVRRKVPQLPMNERAGGQNERMQLQILVALVAALHGQGEHRQDQKRGENHNGCNRSIHQIMVYVQLAAVLNKRAGFNHNLLLFCIFTYKCILLQKDAKTPGISASSSRLAILPLFLLVPLVGTKSGLF